MKKYLSIDLDDFIISFDNKLVNDEDNKSPFSKSIITHVFFRIEWDDDDKQHIWIPK